jgi:hypothetical protein
MITMTIICLLRHYFPQTRKKEYLLLHGYRLTFF